jgi:hypothetical protein
VTDVTNGQNQDEAQLSAADEQVLRELTERARAGGPKLTGEGGLLGKLTKMVAGGALEGELDDHLGYGKHDPAGRDGGNSRNGEVFSVLAELLGHKRHQGGDRGRLLREESAEHPHSVPLHSPAQARARTAFGPRELVSNQAL